MALLRDRIRVQVDGGLRTSRDVIIAALLGGGALYDQARAWIIERRGRAS